MNRLHFGYSFCSFFLMSWKIKGTNIMESFASLYQEKYSYTRKDTNKQQLNKCSRQHTHTHNE